VNDSPPSPLNSAPSRAPYAVLALVVLVTLACFSPALQAGFIDWDEDPLLIKNLGYRGLGLTQLGWMFSTTRMGHYMPLTWLSYAWDFVLWGMNPLGYHLTNLLVHCASAAVLYLIALRLLSAAPSPLPSPPRGGEGSSMPPIPSGERAGVRGAAAFAALLWAIHPLRVESVAWITERRDMLSGLFFLLAVLGYLGYCGEEPGGPRRRRLYWLSLGSFTLALLSKGIVATLPAVLLLLDVYPLRRIGDWPSARRALLEKIPFLALALAAVAVGFWAVVRGGGMTPVGQLGWLGRVAISVYAFAFYLWTSVWPAGLSPLYELPVPLDPMARAFLLAGLVVAAITAAAVLLRRRWPALLAAWVAYLLLLLPVAGLAHNGYQIAADRYTYLPAVALALLAGGAVAAVGVALSRRHHRILAAVLAALVIASLGAATWRQTGFWRDGVTLWQRALARDPASGIAHANLGGELAKRSRVAEAVKEFDEAIRLRPNYAEAHLFLGVLMAQQGHLADAAALFERALELRPGFADAHNNLGVTLARAGRLRLAEEHFREAARLAPDSADARNNLGLALAQQGRLAEAEAQFQEAVRLRPDFREAQGNLARARQLLGR
jgi:tetratricopeptide (TPR) repeat protein